MYPGRILHCLLIGLIFFYSYASSSPSAFSVNPSTIWYGDDGSWSAVSIRVGSPQQWVDVLVSTGSSETWVVGSGGCDGTSTCTSKRGGLFNYNQSSTWQPQGLFDLGLDTQLGFGGYADYGLDTLEFGTTGVTLQDTVIGSINTTEYLLGFFGLGNIAGNFTNVEVTSPVSALENQSVIPSNSYGYTAGAIYQAKSEPCSLTLGGYDANRFVPHNISFGLSPIYQPEAWVNSISVSSSSSTAKPQNWSSNSLQLLAPADGVYVIIDSSTPFLWLPKKACDNFANALGLTYDNSLQLYTFGGNSSIHDDLTNWNLNFTISLSDTSNPTQLVNITLPYAAFDLQLSYPYLPNTTYGSASQYYFPLRQAANDTQYVLGRSFLQEAYLITDYERNNFSVHQVLHPANPGDTNIIDILKPEASSTPTQSLSPLGTPIIIGIAVGASILLILLALAIFLICCHRHRRRRQQHLHAIVIDPKSDPSSSSSASKSKSPGSSAGTCSTLSAQTPSLHSSSPAATTTTPVLPFPFISPSYSASALPTAIEADSTPILPRHEAAEISADASHQRFELPAPHQWPEELDGRNVAGRRAGEEKFAGGAGPGSEWEGENLSGGKFRGSMKFRWVKEKGKEEPGDDEGWV